MDNKEFINDKKNGLTNPELATKYKIPQNRVKYLVRKLGLGVDRSRISKTDLLALIEEGKTKEEIYTSIGITRGGLNVTLRKYGIRFREIERQCVDGLIPCTQCGEIKTCQNDFYLNSSGIPHSYCKSCMIKNTVERQRQIKAQAVEYNGGKCNRCGYSECLGSLQFHHLDTSEKDPNWKNFKMKTFSQDMILELDKCELLCANCHLAEHCQYC